ncbi:MMPL family transporter [Mycolicibacterium sp. OfavD-34-C]|uniref:MMPL family transporter n=1 Tax=Mycolicibacterium sp. OfavD-34-C TaxID=2917746 RepID=UPI001EF6C64C|nr:MMPL family transporter [Mycolicibacterium sp. OfavD-34-C]MCG7583327.1 MMPL family transporter [Mycolicibacterium sp. OfavD-34-C]
MLYRIALLAIAAPRRIVAVAAMVMVASAIFGIPVASHLTAGGFQDPDSESARATKVLTDTFGRGDLQLVFAVTGPREQAEPVGRRLVDRLESDPNVVRAVSAWTAPEQAAAALVSRDGQTGLVVAELTGGEERAPRHAQQIVDEVEPAILPGYPDVTVRAGGSAMVYSQINAQTQRDVVVMEAIALPLSFLVLVWVFKGLLAAAVPVAVGALAIVGSMAVLRLVALGTDVSIFALNLTTALGLALAIDYTLLIVSRFRDEVAAGAPREQALVTTMVTAGRTVLFSALTVALSMAAMVLFPMYFLKSFAYAGVATVALCAAAAVLVTPAAIMLLGDRLDTLDVRRVVRRRPDPVDAHERFWYRSTKFVTRRAVLVALAGTVLLVALGLPFLRVSWGLPDERVLPRSASAYQVGELVRTAFPDNAEASLTVVVPDADGLTAQEYERYAAAASRIGGVTTVSAPPGIYADGRRVGPPSEAAGTGGGAAFLTVGSTTALFTEASQRQLDALRALPGPGGREVAITGIAQVNRDSVAAIEQRLPVVLGVIAAITLVLLFVLTGSVVLPIKALILNMLSLTAAFGALVWIFQEGHLGAFGTTPTGALVANMPVLLFCIAFGLSMDYEVFIIARIREFWLASGRTRADNDESVALGLAHTGRVVTAAALIMSISFGALIAAQVSFMRMFGLGLTLAVLVDATLVRMGLLPAYMRLMGRWNWWAPPVLSRLVSRPGTSRN